MSLESLEQHLQNEPEEPSHPFKLRWSLERKLGAAMEELARIRAENRRFRTYTESAIAHARLAQLQMGKLRKQMFRKKPSKRAQVALPPGLRYINSAAGKEKHRKDMEEKRAREQEKENRRIAREARDEAQAQRRLRAAIDTTPFKGPVSGMNKADLQVLASALGLSYDPKRTTKEELRKAILAHLSANAETLQDNPRFSALYTVRGRRAAPNTADQAAPQVESRSTSAATVSAVAGPSTAPLSEGCSGSSDSVDGFVIGDEMTALQSQLSSSSGPVYWSVDSPPTTPHRPRVPFLSPSPHANRVEDFLKQF